MTQNNRRRCALPAESLTPELVRDYIILHELAHLRQMNHSEKFWQEVGRLCPNYPEAECWPKEHRELLH